MDQRISSNDARSEIIARIRQNKHIRKTEALKICGGNNKQLENILDNIPGLMKTTDDKNRLCFFIVARPEKKLHTRKIGQPLLRGHVTVGA